MTIKKVLKSFFHIVLRIVVVPLILALIPKVVKPVLKTC